ncbi:BPTI/Kunitz domain-containing protein-like [Liolophura sinensis]|uniref:BPTI/Kunitz domain-containing protein-like n=1 Tax=Liolophura sinensis TaxID=3198878 RepID=UPI003158D472
MSDQDLAQSPTNTSTTTLGTHHLPPSSTTAAPDTAQVESVTRKPLTNTLCRDGASPTWRAGTAAGVENPVPAPTNASSTPADRFAVCCPIPVPDDEPTQVPVSQKRLPMCEQPAKVGMCKASLPRWHFNSKSGKCEFFRYGGCEGNANNFSSLESCENACGKPGVSYCSLPPVVGRCRAAFHRFYYDSNAGACKEFTYGGCEGNGNNFVSPAQCEQFCRPKTIYV